jgi:hypothetical protein
MIKTVDYDIVGSFNNQRVSSIDAERSVNMFEYIDALGKKPKSLINTSGLINTNSNFGLTTGGFRAQFVFQGNQYIVIGASVILINSLGVISIIGNLINTTSGYVGIDANTFQVIFVDGIDGYIWDTNATTFTRITDQSFPTQPIDVCYLDGFFVVANGNTNTFQLSMFNQGMVWGPSENFFTADASTSLLTVSSTDNYQTGVPVIFQAAQTSDTFTAASATDLLTLADTTNYVTGGPVHFSTPGGSTLPDPLVTSTTYFTINESPTTLKVALTYSDAINNIPIDLTTDSTGSPTITNELPQPLNNVNTYYTIRVSSTTLRVATSYDNAINNMYIMLESNGGGNNSIIGTGQLQLGEITTHPGTIVACRTLHRRLFLFSQFFTEVWENAGTGTNLPFRRNNNALIEYGTPAIGSISVGFDRMFFLSQDRDGLGSVMQVEGTTASPISTRALDFIYAQYAADNHISDCRAFLIKENGIIFYRMNFTEANHTFVYNFTLSNQAQEQTRLWHEEEVLNGDRHPTQTHAYFNGLNYVGHYLSPILYILDSATYTNDGEAIRRMRITKAIVPPGYQRLRIDRLQIDLLQGNISQLNTQFLPLDLLTENSFIITTEDGDDILLEQGFLTHDPLDLEVFLSISKDGGQTYGYKQSAPMGNIGQRTFRTLWRKLGTIPRGQAFVTKFEFFEAVPFIILGASWAFEELPE